MFRTRLILGILAILAASLSLLAQEPVRDLRGLVGTRARDGEHRMEKHGYRFVRTQQSGPELYNYFRENSSNRCVTVHVVRGRYKSIVYVPDADCGGVPSGNGSPAYAGRGVQDLVGAPAADGEAQMQQRGYQLARVAIYNFYSRGDECQQVEITDGRYNAITRVPNSACNVPTSATSGEPGNYGGNVKVPHVRVDTAGRGTYNGPEGSVRITRGWVDTERNQTIVALSGERHFKVLFSGPIVRRDGEREFTMRINNSDHGNANGTATFRLNEDRNEVESISLSGSMNGQNFNGSFNR